MVYNELNPLVYRAFSAAIRGELPPPRWVSKEEFDRVKGEDFYAAFCFSFGNGLNTYAYSPENAKWKKIVNEMLTGETVRDRRLAYKKFVAILPEMVKPIDKIQHLEAYGRIQNLERLERLERLELKNQDYREVEIPEGAVVYCDPPYAEVSGYKEDFDTDGFRAWALNMAEHHRVFVSEYNMPSPWESVLEIECRCTMARSSNTTKRCEKLYTIRS